MDTPSLLTTDKDVLERFVRAVGGIGRVHMTVARTGRKDCWRWDVQDDNEAPALLRRMLPHLGERRRSRGLEALALRDAVIAASRAGRACPVCGAVFVPVPHKRPSRVCSTRCWQRDYRERRGEYLDAKAIEYRARNREKINAKARAWRIRNRDLVNAKRRARRAKAREAKSPT